MRITDEQSAILNSISCKKIDACCTEWLDDIQPIMVKGKPNSTIPKFFKDIVDADDEAYASFVLLSPEGKVLLFYTLRCGELLDILETTESENEYVKRCIPLYKKMVAGQDFEINYKEYFKIKSEAESQGIQPDWLEKLVERNFDAKKEPTPGINRVNRVHSAIEIVAYGKTAHADDFKRSNSLPKSMAQTLFWHFIIPHIEEIQKLVGCKYAYLFAADEKPEGELVSMYENSLHFNANDGLSVSKPLMDNNCWLKYQKMSELSKWKNQFFEDYNPDDENI